MPHPKPLPAILGDVFSVHAAQAAGVSAERLRRGDLEAPFRGVRASLRPPEDAEDDPYARRIQLAHRRAIEYLPRLAEGQFFSHQTAAALWGAPLPGYALPEDPTVHVSTLGKGPLVRASGVTAHRARAQTTRVELREGMPRASAASTWASLAFLPTVEIVTIGDYLCRVWRPGFGRPYAGRTPLTTRNMLHAAIAAGRRQGNPRLRDALVLIREDSWSPRESALRYLIVTAGLPEPELNLDVFDAHGDFLACVDLAYPQKKVAVEYQGFGHSARYAADVERLAALRAAGWTVVEVTAAVFARPEILLRRIRHALAP